MTTLDNIQSLVRSDRPVELNIGQFVRENVTSSTWKLLWLIVLAYITLQVTISQFGTPPLTDGYLGPAGSLSFSAQAISAIFNPVLNTVVILVLWAVTVFMTVINEVTKNHTPMTLWLKNNLYSSITNVLLTLLLTLLLVGALRGFMGWAFVRASWTTNSELAEVQLSLWEEEGANWGGVIDNLDTLFIFRFPRDQIWRLWAAVLLPVVLGIPSFFIYREKYRKHPIRRIMTILWVLSPVIWFTLLRGFGESGPVEELNPDIAWGGFVLTIIISVFAIVASFPLGVLLALGRRSTIRGIPVWLVWPVAILATGYFLFTSTLPALDEARTFLNTLTAFWPLLILLFAYIFVRFNKGNVVALLSTVYIEAVRGVPFITVLFMSIILFPIFLPPGLEILGTWRVLAAAALFAAAYLAENVRGGLQSIPKGQYEAGDAIGLNTFQKYRLIILPQALRAVIPAIVGQFIGLFKDTTLVAIVGLIEFLGAANLISAQEDWLGVRREPYVFIAIIYFIGSFVMAWYSRRLETRLGVGER